LLLSVAFFSILVLSSALYGEQPSDRLASAPLVNVSTSSGTHSEDKGTTPVYGYRVVNRYPHDPGAFTQGLMISDGYLYESTGLWGASTVRKVRLETGEVLASRRLDARLFGEGLTDWSNILIQLTWRAGKALIYDKNDLSVLGGFEYQGEGWGITRWKSFLVMSDGTSELRFLDPSTFSVVRRLRVLDGDTPVERLNELEAIGDELFANVWGIDRIARISPESGRVTGWVDLSDLKQEMHGTGRVDVLNGIAYDRGKIYVTGKLWPELFEIELVPATGPTQKSTKNKAQ